MCGQSLNFRQAHDVVSLASKGLLRVLNHAGLFDEIIHRQSGRKSGSACGGQHVIGPSAVVAQYLGRGLADAGNDPEGTTTRQAYDLLEDMEIRIDLRGGD